LAAACSAGERVVVDDFRPAAVVAFGGGDDLAFEGLLPDVVAFDLPGDGEYGEEHGAYAVGVFSVVLCPGCARRAHSEQGHEVELPTPWRRPCTRPGFDGDLQGVGNETADVEETQAALVLLVRFVGAVSDPQVDQNDGRGVAGRLDDGDGTSDADLRDGDARAGSGVGQVRQYRNLQAGAAAPPWGPARAVSPSLLAPCDPAPRCEPG
jgi:hypothetical protein